MMKRFISLLTALSMTLMLFTTMDVTSFTAYAADVDLAIISNSDISVSELTTATQAKITFNITKVVDDAYATLTAYLNGSSYVEETYATTTQYNEGAGQGWQANHEVTATGQQVVTFAFAPATWGYQVGIKTDNADGFDAELIKVEFLDASGNVVKAYDPTAPVINKDNFTYSTLNNTSMEIGDSFTIAYNAANTPLGAKYSFKYKVPNASGSEDYYTPVLDNAVNGTDGQEATGLKVTSSTAGDITTYTFTAIAASAAEFELNIEVSASGTWSDTSYLWFGSATAYKVVAPAAPSYNLTPSNKEIEIGDYQIFTLEGYDGQEPPTWEIDETYVDIITTGVDVDNNQCKLIGKAATDPTTVLTVTLNGKIVGTATITVVEAAAEPTYTIDPDTATIKVGESKVFTLKGYEGTEPLIWSIDTDYADMQLDSELTRNQVKIVGRAKSDGPLTLTIKKSESEILATANVTIVEADVPPAAETVELAFPTGVIELAVEENEWDGQDPHGLMAKGNFNEEASSLIGKTFAEIKNTTLKMTGAKFDNCSISSVKKGEVKVRLFTSWTGWNWKDSGDIPLDSTDFTFDLSTITGVADTDELLQIGIQISINDGDKFTGLKAGDTVTINDDSITPPKPPVTGDKTFEGEATITCDNYWGQTTITLEQLIGDLDPAKTTVVFTGEFINKIGYNSVTQTPAADGSKWREIEAANGKITLDASDLVTDGFYFVIAAGKESGDATISWVATEKGGQVTPPAHTHTPAQAWTSNATGHWHACTCDEKFDFTEHTSDGGNITTQPTETTAGVKTYKCTVCDYVIKTETVPATGTGDNPGHTHTPATAWTSDATGHWHACTCDEKLDFSAHTYANGICIVCGAAESGYVPPHTHVFGTEWKYSETRHWHECACGERTDETLHTPDGGTVTKQPTAYETGVRSYYCTVCGSFIFSETIPAVGTAPDPVTPYFPPSGTVTPFGAVSNEPYLQNDSGKSGWEVISGDILSTPDGEAVRVKMNGTTELPQNIVSDIAGRDIDLVLDMGGYSWTINGMSVTKAKDVDLRVRKVNKIPESTIQEFFGDSKTVQIDLRHNGDFGFIAELTVNVGKRYSGKFANSYCFKSGNFEFGDSSEIVNGKARLRFTHASSWLIAIDTSPVLEDVSSGAAAHSAGTPLDMSNSASGVTVPEFDEKKGLRLLNSKRRYRILKKRKLDDLVFVL